MNQPTLICTISNNGLKKFPVFLFVFIYKMLEVAAGEILLYYDLSTNSFLTALLIF
jgi:hypothetical protein